MQSTHERTYTKYTCIFLCYKCKANLNASKPPDLSKGLGGNIGCRDEITSWD